jgi:hypothetical protein
MSLEQESRIGQSIRADMKMNATTVSSRLNTQFQYDDRIAFLEKRTGKMVM